MQNHGSALVSKLCKYWSVADNMKITSADETTWKLQVQMMEIDSDNLQLFKAPTNDKQSY